MPTLKIRTPILAPWINQIWLCQSKTVSHIMRYLTVAQGFQRKSHSLEPEVTDTDTYNIVLKS